MSSKLTRIKEELKEAGMTTTGHVIMLIIRSQYWPMKIIFLLAWLIGLGLTLYLATNNILDYYKYDVTTQTRVIREQPMIFPKVGATTDLTLVNWFISNDVYFESQALYAAYSADNKTRMSLGYDKDTFIRACYFNTDYCELYDNFIEQIYDIKFGNCFTFNGQTKSKLLTSGILI